MPQLAIAFGEKQIIVLRDFPLNYLKTNTKG